MTIYERIQWVYYLLSGFVGKWYKVYKTEYKIVTKLDITSHGYKHAMHYYNSEKFFIAESRRSFVRLLKSPAPNYEAEIHKVKGDKVTRLCNWDKNNKKWKRI